MKVDIVAYWGWYSVCLRCGLHRETAGGGNG